MANRLFIICLVVAGLMGCRNNRRNNNTETNQRIATADNSQNSLDWKGAYHGTLPCADCAGIKTTLTLKADSTYELVSRYMGKDNNTFKNSGSFKWNKKGNKISLQKDGKDATSKQYLVGEHKLIQLDMHGNKIKGALVDHYVLQQDNNSITNTYWKLLRLHGKKITKEEHQKREAHFVLESNKINGNGGCNTFHGSYKRAEDHMITFSKVASTKMACVNIHYENEYLKVFSDANGYTLNGDTLSLNKSGKTLATFVEKPGK